VKKEKEESFVTSIAATNHENPGRKRNEIAHERSESRITLVPIEGTTLLDVARVPIERVAVVVGVAARHIPEHLPNLSYCTPTVSA